jgi:hypothetical protein
MSSQLKLQQLELENSKQVVQGKLCHLHWTECRITVLCEVWGSDIVLGALVCQSQKHCSLK